MDRQEASPRGIPQAHREMFHQDGDSNPTLPRSHRRRSPTARPSLNPMERLLRSLMAQLR
jgi:hypothetical protein